MAIFLKIIQLLSYYDDDMNAKHSKLREGNIHRDPLRLLFMSSADIL